MLIDQNIPKKTAILWFIIIVSNQIKSLLLSHHHSTSALVSEILMSVLQTVQKNNRQFTYGQTVQKNNRQFTYGQTVYTVCPYGIATPCPYRTCHFFNQFQKRHTFCRSFNGEYENKIQFSNLLGSEARVGALNDYAYGMFHMIYQV